MSEWSHPMCEDCWIERYGDRTPTRVIAEHRAAEHCCWCGKRTRSGIYAREDPEMLVRHTPHAE